MKLFRDMEQTLNVNAHYNGEEQRKRPDARVAEQAGANYAARILQVARSFCFGYVSNDGRPNAKIKQAVIPGDGKNQYPNPKCRVTKPVQDVRREKETYGDVRRERNPA